MASMPAAHPADPVEHRAALERLLHGRRVCVITGAGISTASGIPGYRDREANWARKPPVTHQDFIASEATRRRYWARSLIGWPQMRAARPNAAHHALARLQAAGAVGTVVTQNVDGLHEAAGSADVLALHGRLAEVRCLDCGALASRAGVQAAMEAANPAFAARRAAVAPDGDADLEGDFDSFVPPACAACGGMVKPDVVFYGDSVPRERARAADRAIETADALLVVGSTLMVRSAFRLVEAAHGAGKPVAAINLGRTRADAMLSFKVEADCGAALAALAEAIGARAPAGREATLSWSAPADAPRGPGWP